MDLAQRVQGGGGYQFAGREHRDARRVGRDQLGADPADGGVGRDGLVRREKRLPRREHRLRHHRPRGSGGRVPRRAAMPLHRGGEHLGERGDLVLVVGDRDDRDDRVAVGHLHRHPGREQVGLDGNPMCAGPGQQHDQLGRLNARPVENVEARHLPQPAAGRGHAAQQPGTQVLAVPRQQRPGRVGARHDRARRAGGVCRVERPLQPRRVQPLGPRHHQRGLSAGRQRLVRAGHHRVGAGGERVRRQVGVEAKVRRPGGVHDQRHPGLVRHGGVAGQVADRAHVGGIAEEHRASAGVLRQGRPHGLHGHRGREPRPRVHLRPDPYRAQPGEHQAEQQGPVQDPGDDDLLAGRADGQGQRLVAVRGPGHGEPAPVGTPQPCRPRLALDPQHVRMLDRVERAVQRRVAGDHIPDEIAALLVPGGDHRRKLAGFRALHGGQPGVEQRRVGSQSPRIPGVIEVRHPPSLHDRRKQGEEPLAVPLSKMPRAEGLAGWPNGRADRLFHDLGGKRRLFGRYPPRSWKSNA